ncbi:MAG: hypothetical protein IKN57_01440 [Parasporobacterium sp.]|nr:hypothetical protein [Parasporobacterium sp.]
MAKKTLIVYYSLSGNIDYVAGEVRRNLRLSMQKLEPEQEPPKTGLKKLIVGGKSALSKKTDIAIKPLQYSPENYDTILIACPVWAGTYPPAIATFLKQYTFTGKNVYLIGASAGGNAEKMFDKIKAALPGNEFKDTLSLKAPLKDKEKTSELVGEFCRKNNL